MDSVFRPLRHVVSWWRPNSLRKLASDHIGIHNSRSICRRKCHRLVAVYHSHPKGVAVATEIVALVAVDDGGRVHGLVELVEILYVVSAWVKLSIYGQRHAHQSQACVIAAWKRCCFRTSYRCPSAPWMRTQCLQRKVYV